MKQMGEDLVRQDSIEKERGQSPKKLKSDISDNRYTYTDINSPGIKESKPKKELPLQSPAPRK